jgi:hypothetical protein
MSSKICRYGKHPQPCSFFPNGTSNPPSQPRIPLYPIPASPRLQSFSDPLDFPEQLHCPPGVGSTVWTASTHQFPNFPHEELTRHSLCSDCGIPSPGSIPSGASTEGSLSHPVAAMSNDEGTHSDEEITRANLKAIRDDDVTGTFDWEWNSTLPLGNSRNIGANDLFFDEPAYIPGGSIPTFQVSLDHSLAHGLNNQDRLTEPGIELSGLESIHPSVRQAEGGPWPINSQRPQSAEYAPSNLGISVNFHEIVLKYTNNIRYIVTFHPFKLGSEGRCWPT